MSIKLDYISIIFDSMTAEEVISKILELSVNIFMKRPGKVKHKAYQSIYQAGSIKVYGDEKTEEKVAKGKGCYLVLSGMGCDEIYRILNMRGFTFGNFFWLCEKRCGKDNFHLTRLDIAIDDKNEIPYFTPEQIKRKCEKEEFIANSNSYKFV